MRFTEARVLRVISVVLWARWVAAAIWFVGCAVHFKQMVTPYEPYGLFGASFGRLWEILAVALAALWLAWFIPAYRTARGPDAAGSVGGRGIVLAVHLLISWLLFVMGINSANALFDFSARRIVTVHVENTHAVHHIDKNGGRGYSTRVANVTLVDHPGEHVEIDLPDCYLSGTARPSPFRTVTVGRGAFGYPWVSHVECHPLQVTDRPLFDDFFLGHGQAAVVATVGFEEGADFTVERKAHLMEGLRNLRPVTDPSTMMENIELVLTNSREFLTNSDQAALSALFVPATSGGGPLRAAAVDRARALVRATLDRTDPAYLVPRWLTAIQAAAPGTRVVWVHPYDKSGLVPNVPCSTCAVVDITRLDRDIAALFFAPANGSQTNHLYLADGAGHRVFSAKLSELDRRAELITKLATLHSK